MVKMLAKCSSCSIKIDIGPNPRPYQRIVCPDCGAYLEIINIDPSLLDWVFEESKDYYDEMCLADWNL